jgi:hypothetical protein
MEKAETSSSTCLTYKNRPELSTAILYGLYVALVLKGEPEISDNAPVVALMA